MKPTIKWNADLFGVEIQTGDEHFVISAQPSMVMTWNDAARYFVSTTTTMCAPSPLFRIRI